MKNTKHLFPPLLLLLIFASCKPTPPVVVVEKVVEVKKVQDIDESVTKEIESILSQQLTDSTLAFTEDTLHTLPFIKPLFSDYLPFWTHKGTYKAIGDSMFTLIKEARYYGLIPDDYHYTTLEELKTKMFTEKDSTYDAFAIAKTEILLTDAYFKFGAHVARGRVRPDTLALIWQPHALGAQWLDVMNEGLKSNNPRAAFDSLEPKHEGYQFLKTELKKFLVETQEMDWDSLGFETTPDSAFKAQLKKRLMLTCDYDTLAKGKDSVKLSKAIKSFQKRMNLEPDGKLGKYTRQALALSKEKLIRQIEMAMERWRWEAAEFPDKYFWVNIPSADLHLWEKDTACKDTLVLYSRVVVGKPETPTPLLRSKVNFIIIYPYWTAPFSIAVKEILPAVQRDTSYLRRKGFEVVTGKGKVMDISKINFKKYNKDYLPFRFRQRIGGDNSLGICKFNFNNKYGVYMHDTNSKKYFATFYRWQSHGCVRLEKFMEVAQLLTLEDTIKTPPDSLASYFNTPNQRQINLKKPVPIFIRYYTAMADSTGLQFYLDIYRRDEKMMDLLYKDKGKTTTTPLLF